MLYNRTYVRIIGGDAMKQTSVLNHTNDQVIVISNPEYIDDLIIAVLDTYANQIEP